MARASARTVPVTRTDDSWVTASAAFHVSSDTSFLKTTHCTYPLPSRMIGNCSFPEVRLLYSQPLMVTFSPMCWGRSLMRAVVIRRGILSKELPKHRLPPAEELPHDLVMLGVLVRHFADSVIVEQQDRRARIGHEHRRVGGDDELRAGPDEIVNAHEHRQLPHRRKRCLRLVE